MQRAVSRKKLLFHSFLIPFVLQIAVFLAVGISPFGSRGLIFSDAIAYIIKDFTTFRQQLYGSRSILYSFTRGLGDNNIYSLTSFFLPHSWLMLLSGWDYFEPCFSMAVIIVISIYGVTMMLLLCDIFDNSFSNLIFSTCYALMGYSVVYNYCVVLFAGPLFLPLMVLGIRKIFRGESGLLYAVSIALSTASLIQLGWILCTTSVLFFVVKFVLDKSINRKLVLRRYALFSVLGGLLPAAVWVPSLLPLIEGRAKQNGLEDLAFEENTPILQMFSRLFSGSASISQIINGLPAIFCGILTVALVVMFFLDKGNPKEYRIAFGVMLSTLFLTFYIRLFTTIIHGSHTNWFNYRNSFVFSFVLLIIAACEYERITKVERNVIVVALTIISISTALIFSQKYEHISGGNMVFDLGLLSAMVAGIALARRNPEKTSATTLTILLLMCTCLQLYVNYYVCMQHIYDGVWKDAKRTESEFQGIINKKQPLVQAIRGSDTTFYRMEDEYQLTGTLIGNDASFFDYDGLGQSNLTVNKQMALTETKFGITFTRDMMCSYGPGVPAAMDSLLGLKYVITPRDLTEEKNYVKLVKGMYEDEGDIYLNPYALSIAMLSDRGVTDVDISRVKDVFQVQNIVWKALTNGNRDLFTEEGDVRLSMHNPNDDLSMEMKEMRELPDLTASQRDDEEALQVEASASNKGGAGLNREDYLYKSYIEYEFVAAKTGPIYLYDSAAFDDADGTDEDVLQYVGYFNEGDKVVGRLVFDYSLTSEVFVATGQGLRIAYADMDALEEYANLLNSGDVTIEKVADHHLRGRFNASEGQQLFFTIPFQKGWRLFIDGQETTISQTCNLFMSAPVTAGEHTYELKFWPPGLTLGIIISIVACAGLVCLCVVGAKRTKGDGVMAA